MRCEGRRNAGEIDVTGRMFEAAGAPDDYFSRPDMANRDQRLGGLYVLDADFKLGDLRVNQFAGFKTVDSRPLLGTIRRG